MRAWRMRRHPGGLGDALRRRRLALSAAASLASRASDGGGVSVDGGGSESGEAAMRDA